MSLDKLVVNRQTYSLLDWMGDLGGLFDALYIFCNFIVMPVSVFNLQATLMSRLFRQRPSDMRIKRQNTFQKSTSFFNKYFSVTDEASLKVLLQNIKQDFQVA